MSRLDDILAQAGFGSPTSATEQTARAVALGESGGSATAYNPSGATGLFQIMPATARGYGFDPSRLFEPLYNAVAAFKISSGGTNWSQWSAYTNGSYRHYLAGAGQPDPAPVGGSRPGWTTSGGGDWGGPAPAHPAPGWTTSGGGDWGGPAPAAPASDVGGAILTMLHRSAGFVAGGAVVIILASTRFHVLAWGILAVAGAYALLYGRGASFVQDVDALFKRGG